MFVSSHLSIPIQSRGTVPSSRIGKRSSICVIRTRWTASYLPTGEIPHVLLPGMLILRSLYTDIIAMLVETGISSRCRHSIRADMPVVRLMGMVFIWCKWFLASPACYLSHITSFFHLNTILLYSFCLLVE